MYAILRHNVWVSQSTQTDKGHVVSLIPHDYRHAQYTLRGLRIHITILA